MLNALENRAKQLTSVGLTTAKKTKESLTLAEEDKIYASLDPESSPPDLNYCLFLGSSSNSSFGCLRYFVTQEFPRDLEFVVAKNFANYVTVNLHLVFALVKMGRRFIQSSTKEI